jgi:hypothetical protein
VRKFFTSLFAFLLSGLASGLVVLELAVLGGATEEYIVVFAATVMIVIVVTIGFFLVQFRAEPVRMVDRMFRWLLAIFAIILVALLGRTFWVPAENRATPGDLSIVAGLILPGVVAIVVQWLVVRWWLKRPAATFGRDGASA